MTTFYAGNGDELDRIAVRVMRHGAPVSAFVNELAFLTAEELENMACGRQVEDLVKASPDWSFRDNQDRYFNLKHVEQRGFGK